LKINITPEGTHITRFFHKVCHLYFPSQNFKAFNKNLGRSFGTHLSGCFGGILLVTSCTCLSPTISCIDNPSIPSHLGKLSVGTTFNAVLFI
jgi:hypothetical protein